MWELDYKESWAQKNWCFWSVVSEKTLESPLESRWFKQSILKEISPGCSLEGLMLKLKLQNFGHLMQRAESLEKTWCWERLRAGGEGAEKGWDGWMAPSTQWTWVWVDSRSWWWTGRPGMLQFMGSQRVGQDWATELTIYYSRMICELLLYSRKIKIFIYLSLFNYSNLPFFLPGETRRSQVEWNLYKIQE